MRPSANVPNNNMVKEPVKLQSGPSVRPPIKKTYCPKCQRLVKGQMQNSSNNTKVVCPRCTLNLWSWNKICWRSAVNGANGGV